MNDKTGGGRGLRRAGALAVAAAVTMLAAGCGVVHVHFGNGSASPSASSPTYAQLVALAQCMRSHSEPDFPDPSASGSFSSSVLSTLNTSQGQAAYGACRHLLAGGGPSISQLQQEQQQAQQQEEKALPALLKFSQCMRSHGVPDFPDLPESGQASPAPSKGTGINPSSPQYQSAYRACKNQLPPGVSISGTPHKSGTYKL